MPSCSFFMQTHLFTDKRQRARWRKGGRKTSGPEGVKEKERKKNGVEVLRRMQDQEGQK